MAKLQSGVLENFSGSIGDLNFYKWKNKFVIRAKRTPTKKPPTEAQLLVREKFRILSELYEKLKESSRIGFKTFTSSMTEKNAFFKYNYDSLYGSVGEINMNYPKLVLSFGNLNGIQAVGAKKENSSFYFNWKSNTESNHLDKVHVILLSIYEKDSPVFSESELREEKVEIKIPNHWKGITFHSYGFIENQKGAVSNSQYLGEFLVS